MKNFSTQQRKITMPGIQSKITSNSKKKKKEENMTPRKKKNESIETDPEITRW